MAINPLPKRKAESPKEPIDPKPALGDGTTGHAHQIERYVALGVAVWIIMLLSYLILSDRAFNTTSVYFLKILLSLSMAVLVSSFAGFINLSFSLPGLALRAGGALAVFVFVFTQSPSVPVLGLDEPRVQLSPVGLMDFRALVAPNEPDFKDSPIAITAPIELKNIGGNSRSGTLRATSVKLNIAGISADFRSYYFVELLPGVAGTWLSSGQLQRASAVDLNPGQVFSREVMHLAAQGPSWEAFVAALSEADEPVQVTVEAELDNGDLSVECTFDPSIYGEAAAELERETGILPGYVSVQCNS